MQFNAQTEDYRTNYPDASFEVIERDGMAAGRLLVMRSDAAVHVIDIALMPEHRGAGIGTKLLNELQDEASGAEKAEHPCRAIQSRAAALDRFGFRQVEEKELICCSSGAARNDDCRAGRGGGRGGGRLGDM